MKRVADGRLKSPEKIDAAAGAILSRNHGHRYYDWSLKKGVFSLFEGISTSLANRHMRANTLSRPRSLTSRPLRRSSFKRSCQKLSERSAVSKTCSTCDPSSSQKRSGRGPCLRCHASVRLASLHREETQGRWARPLSNRRAYGVQVSARGRYRLRQRRNKAHRYARQRPRGFGPARFGDLQPQSTCAARIRSGHCVGNNLCTAPE